MSAATGTLEAMPASSGRKAWTRFRRHRAAVAGSLLVALMLLLALAAPALAPYGYEDQNLALGPTGPSADHIFGTDYAGRDLFSRVLYGARISFAVGVLATLVSLLIGVTWGAVAGYFGGRVDAVMMRLVDVLYGLPYMFFVIILMVWFGRSFVNIFIGLGAVSWLTMARIVRGSVLGLREQEFVLAARASGIGAFAIIRRHILPNCTGPIIVYATLTVPRVMIEEAFLSFIGLGVQPPMASWGSLISEGSSLFREYPWLLIFPATFLSLTLLSLNFIGDGLRDALDPRTKTR